MYQVLLVDDERIILEGISSIVDWEAQGTILSGTARNGLEALAFIEKSQPDIVISDITMPGLDGMGLIEECHKKYPLIKWIFLSGYNEFEYAQKAMRYGVKHYILKPCNEEVISEALKDMVEELETQQEKTLYLKSMENKTNSALKEEKELLFKEVLTNRTVTEDKIVNFCKKYLPLSHLQEPVRLVLFHLEDSLELAYLQQIKNMAEKQIGEKFFQACTVTGNELVILVGESIEYEHLLSSIDSLQNIHFSQNNPLLTVVISKQILVTEIYPAYQKLEKCKEEKFYAEKGSIILEEDFIEYGRSDRELYEYEMERLVLLIKAKRQSEAKQELNKIIKKIQMVRLKPVIAKTYLIQLYFSIKKINSPVIGETNMEEINDLESLETLASFHAMLEREMMNATTNENSKKHARYSSVVVSMLTAIQENLENPDLSLQWIANNALYMNTDYLGKLFKKEIGEKFSTFVMNKRIDRAVEIIEEENDVKVFELAERIGFGNNPQYFSQIFKKRTGCSPSDVIRTN